MAIGACASSAPTADRVEVEVRAPPAVSDAASAELAIRTSSPAKPAASGAPRSKPDSASAGTPFPFPIGVPAGTAASAQSTATVLAVARPKDTARIGALAATEAPGLQPSGSAQSARFKQGDVLRVSATLTPGMCLTAIAVGDGIGELDMHVAIAPSGAAGLPGFPPMVVATDTKTGPVAIVGGGGQCFKSPLPLAMPIVVVVTATQGQGEATVQLFTK